MVNLQVTAFHLDFSTLDIEKGQVTLPPFGLNYIIQPQLLIQGSVLEEEQVQVDERVSTQKRRKQLPRIMHASRDG